MPLETVTGLTLAAVLVNGLAQVIGLVLLMRGQRELSRMARALAGLIVQEEAKTRAQIQAAGGRS